MFPEYVYGLEERLSRTPFLEGNHPTMTDTIYMKDFLYIDRANLAREWPHISEWMRNMSDPEVLRMIRVPREDLRVMHRRLPDLEFTEINIDTTGKALDKHLSSSAANLFGNEGAAITCPVNFDERGNMLREVSDYELAPENDLYSMMIGHK